MAENINPASGATGNRPLDDENPDDNFKPMSQNRLNRWAPERWIAAAIARENGFDPANKYDPFGLWPGGLFQTAEQIQEMMGLDYLPKTEESYTVPFFDNEKPILLKYCWLILKDSLDLTDIVELVQSGEGKRILVDGKRRLVFMPTKLKRKSKSGKTMS